MKNIKAVAMIAGMALAMSGFAGAQTESTPPPPKPKATPKVAPAPKAPYAMAWTSSSGSGSYLGVDISEVTSERLGPLKLKEERGVEITMVDRDAPAGKAGLKVNDVILDFNGNRVEGEEQLRRMLRETPAGRKITLGISRDGQPMQVEATLAAREGVMVRKSGRPGYRFEMPDVVIPPMPDIQIPQFEVMVRSYSRSTGMMVDNLTPQLGEFFGVKSGQGVLVRSVEKGSAAEAAGLKAGDVIVKVDNEAIDDRNDWNRVMRKKGGKVSFGIVRDKREQTLTVTLPERKSSEESRYFEELDFEGDFDFQSQGFDAERMERAMRELRKEFEIKAPRIVDRQVHIQKTMAVQQAQLAERMAKTFERSRRTMEQQRERLEKEQKELHKKLEDAARKAEHI
ncbi:MAG: PDZ domain-containing protein [Terriglobales bacterium]